MPRITPQLLTNPQNPPYHITDHTSGLTLSLRSLSIPIIENLEHFPYGVSTYDLTGNDIVTLGNFPVNSHTVETVLMARNRIREVQQGLGLQLPNLQSLSLIQNQISSFQEISKLKSLDKLRNLYVRNNPISEIPEYRLFTIWLLPQLNVLDGSKITPKERQSSIEQFGTVDQPSTTVEQLLLSQNSAKNNSENDDVHTVLKKLTDEDRQRLKSELMKATSLKEIERIEEALKSGYV